MPAKCSGPRRLRAATSSDRQIALPPTEIRRDELGRRLEKLKTDLVVVDDEPDVLQSVQDLLRMDYHVIPSERI